MENICKFVPANPIPDVLQTIHFVYETQNTGNGQTQISSVARLHYVTEGNGVLQCGSLEKNVKAGDLFFILPSVPFCLRGNEDFKHYYISFMGLRSSVIMERLNINARNFVFEDFPDLRPLWETAIDTDNEFSDLVSESLLLQMFAKIGFRTAQNRSRNSSINSDKFLLIKKYVDDHFSDPKLSLETISREFSYNKKYISTAFKKNFNLRLTEYLNTLRIRHACALMEQNYTGVADIAFLCGFRDAMYFSKVFKKATGQSPKDYMNRK